MGDKDTFVFGLEEIRLRKGNLISRIPYMGKEFSVSFDLLPTAFGTGWRNVIHFSVSTSFTKECVSLVIGELTDVIYNCSIDEPLDSGHHRREMGDMFLHPSWSSGEWDFGRRMARIPRRLDSKHPTEVAFINYEVLFLKTHITLIADISIRVIIFLRLIWISLIIRRTNTFRLSCRLSCRL